MCLVCENAAFGGSGRRPVSGWIPPTIPLMPETRAVWASLRRGLRIAGRFYVAHILLPVVTLILAIALIVFIDIFAPEGPGDPDGWWDVAVLVAIGLASSGLVGLIFRLEAGGESRTKKIERLTQALKEAAQAIAQISAEMEDGERRLRELEQQTSIQQQLANLTGSQSAAIREALKGELSRERRRSLMRDLVMLVLGAVTSFLLTRWFPLGAS